MTAKKCKMNINQGKTSEYFSLMREKGLKKNNHIVLFKKYDEHDSVQDKQMF